MNTTNAVSTRAQRATIFKKTQQQGASKPGLNLGIFVGGDGNARSLHFSNLVSCSIIVSYPKRFAQSSSAWIAQKKAPTPLDATSLPELAVESIEACLVDRSELALPLKEAEKVAAEDLWNKVLRPSWRFEDRMHWQAYKLNRRVFLERLKRLKRSVDKFVPIYILIRRTFMELYRCHFVAQPFSVFRVSWILRPCRTSRAFRRETSQYDFLCRSKNEKSEGTVRK